MRPLLGWPKNISRLNELRSLRTEHLDTEACALRLDPSWTKNRKGGTQFIPAELAERLAAFARGGAAAKLYREACRTSRHQTPPDNLQDAPLFVPQHPERALEEDLKNAEIKQDGPGGRIDFQSTRGTFISTVVS